MAAQNSSQQDKIQERRNMKEKRCDNCNTLLLNYKITGGKIEVKCRRCGQMNSVEITAPQDHKG